MHADEILKASQREVADLKAALDEHSIVAITDPFGAITYANDRFCAISKYSRDELLGRDHRIINSGYHPKAFFRGLWATIKQGQVWHGEIKNRAKDGSFYWVDTTIVPSLGEDGKPRQFVAIRTDITERKSAEISAARLAAIVESSDDAIIGKDLDGVVTSWNAGAERLFGYSSAEMIGEPIVRIIPADRQREEESILARIRRGESVRHFETVRLCKDGRLVEISVSISAIRDKAGLIVGASKVARDNTEKKRHEALVLQLNSSLEQRVAERTRDLETANRELEAFSYSVSHDLRAPLRAADGFSQAVLEDFGDLLPAEGKRYLHTIRSSTQRMGMLIDDLLSFARLKNYEFRRETVDCSRLVRSVVEDLGFPVPGRTVDLNIGRLPEVSGDATLLRQAWTNLISNALKYTRNRERAKIEIGSVRENASEVFFVRDNGTGFDMKYADKLFGVFQRLHRQEEFEGTGVGLAIVRRIVERHGGRVWFDAAVDNGATFYFTLGPERSP